MTACGRDANGGEPLWIVPKDLLLFFPGQGRPNKVLNRRLPETTARDVLPSVPFGNLHPLEAPFTLRRVKTFVGAACLTQFPVFHAPRQISPGF